MRLNTSTTSRRRKGRTSARLSLEALESRLAPATHQWTGAVSENWSNAANWAGGSPAGDANAVLVFPTTATRFTSTNNIGDLPIQEIDLFGSGYTIGSTNSATRITLGTGGIVASNNTGSNTIGAGLTLAATRTVTVSNTAATLNLTGSIDGAGGLNKEGIGTLAFTGSPANSFTGPLAVNHGTLRLNRPTDDTAVPGGLVIGNIDGSAATVVLDAANQIANSATVAINRNGVLNLNGNAETLGPVVLTSGSLVNSGTGITTLSGGVTATSSKGGTSAKAATISGGALVLTGTGNTFTVNNGIGATDLVVSALVAGSSGLVKDGPGQMSLGSNNAYSGVTTVSQGTLSIANGNALGATGAGSNTVVQAGATLNVDLPNSTTVNETITLDGAGAGVNPAGALTGGGKLAGPITLATDTAVNSTGVLAGVVTGPGSLTKKGTGVLILSGANNYTGSTLVEAGTLSIQNPLALGTIAAPTTVASGAALEVNTSAAGFQEPITLNGSGVGNAGALSAKLGAIATVEGVVTLASDAAIGANGTTGQLTLSNRVTGPGGLTIPGTSFLNPAVTLAGSIANDYAGGTTVKGDLRLNKSAGVNAIPVFGALTITGGLDILSPNQIPDPVPITVTGGRLVYGAPETIGPLTLANGGRVITFDNSLQLTLGGDVTLASGGSFTEISGKVSLGTGPRTFTVAAGASLPLNGFPVSGVSAGNALIKAGAGELILQGGVSYTGTTVVNAGTLTLQTSVPGAVVVNASATLSGGGGRDDLVPNGAVSTTALTLAGGVLNPGGFLTLDDINPNSFIPIQATNTFQVAGNATADANSTFHFDLQSSATPGSGFDQLIVTSGGTLNLGNAHLEIGQPASFSPTVGTAFTIVKNDTGASATTTRFTDAAGAVLGQGAIVTASPSGQRYLLNYQGGDGNDIDLIKLNTAPNAENLHLSASSITEGQTVTLTGKLTDADTGNTLVLVIDWGDGSPVQTVEPGTAPFAVPHTYLNNPAGQPHGAFPIHLLWRDDNGDSNSQDLSVTVRNAAPRVFPGGNITVGRNQLFSRLGSFLDAGAQDTHRITVNFGDGTRSQQVTPTANRRFSLRHRFGRAGTFRVTVTVVDSDGGVGTASFLVTVVG